MSHNRGFVLFQIEKYRNKRIAGTYNYNLVRTLFWPFVIHHFLSHLFILMDRFDNEAYHAECSGVHKYNFDQVLQCI